MRGSLRFPQMGLGSFPRVDARRTEHHDRVAHIRAPQPRQRIEIFRQDAQRASAQAFHESGVVVGELRHGQMAGSLHEFLPRGWRKDPF
jgi:hypothetical protein